MPRRKQPATETSSAHTWAEQVRTALAERIATMETELNELRTVQRAFAAKPAKPSADVASGKRWTMTPAQRKAVSRRMRAYWRKRRTETTK